VKCVTAVDSMPQAMTALAGSIQALRGLDRHDSGGG
jgi:hypothetical protein